MSGQTGERLYMVRESLESLPDLAAPANYSLQWYQPGDEAKWLRIHEKADPLTKLTPGFFRKQFPLQDNLLSLVQVYLIDHEGDAVGTVTAWEGEFQGRRTGRVHWLAVVPEQQGKGLGAFLLRVACERLRTLGFRRAYLVTSPAREAAVRLYKRLGFVEASP